MRRAREGEGCFVVLFQATGAMAFVFGLGSACYLVSLKPVLGAIIGVCALIVYGCYRAVED